MHFLVKQIRNDKMPTRNMLKDRYVLLVNKDGCNTMTTWCGSFNGIIYNSTYFSYRNNKYEKAFIIDTYVGRLDFPLTMKVYLIDKMGFDYYRKIKNHRDLMVFIDNLDETK